MEGRLAFSRRFEQDRLYRLTQASDQCIIFYSTTEDSATCAACEAALLAESGSGAKPSWVS